MSNKILLQISYGVFMDSIFSFNRIDSFSGQFSFLSNFHGGPVTIGGFTFQTSEHAYQALKATNYDDFMKVANCGSPGEAKRMGRKIAINPDWENCKVDTMRVVLVAKFSKPHLRDLLASTNPSYLEEGNTWGDTFWGVCGGKGENHLGKLLMEIRSTI